MEIFYVLGIYPALTENMVAKVYEANAPLAEVDSIIIYEKNGSGVPTPGAGHQVNTNVTFTGLDLVPHILRLFTESGTQLQEFNVLPSANTVTVFDPVYFKIGDGGTNTPAVGDVSYVNSDLAGLTNDDVTVFRNGTLLYPSIHFNTDPGGGFSFVTVGDVFGADEEYYIQRKPQVLAEYVNDSVVGKQWGATTGAPNMYVDVTSSVDYVPAHLRKLIRLSNNNGKYYFRAAASVPIGYPFRFSNQVGGTANIYFENAPLIKPGGDVSSFALISGQIAEFVYDGTKWNKTADSASTSTGYTISGPYLYDCGSINPLDQAFTITIPDQGTTAYTVVGSFEGQQANFDADNDMMWTIHAAGKTNTQFRLAVRKLVAQVVILKFRYFIIKAN